MIEKYYKTINILRYFEGGFDTPAEYKNVGVFKGLIQAPSNSRTFNNSKDTSNVAGTLFCSPSVKFQNKDVIEYNGQRYIIAGQNTQTDGVSGIKPKRGLHAEYRLEWTQEGI